MLEGLAAQLLNRYLSGYINDVDYKNLSLGVFSGSLELNNIQIRPNALVTIY
jgi:vacuolar protein sorting-associated protein 13A/C